jgi:hypothetical protein
MTGKSNFERRRNASRYRDVPKLVMIEIIMANVSSALTEPRASSQAHKHRLIGGRTKICSYK